jgi:hypothetical protein
MLPFPGGEALGSAVETDGSAVETASFAVETASFAREKQDPTRSVEILLLKRSLIDCTPKAAANPASFCIVVDIAVAGSNKVTSWRSELATCSHMSRCQHKRGSDLPSHLSTRRAWCARVSGPRGGQTFRVI